MFDLILKKTKTLHSIKLKPWQILATSYSLQRVTRAIYQAITGLGAYFIPCHLLLKVAKAEGFRLSGC